MGCRRVNDTTEDLWSHPGYLPDDTAEKIAADQRWRLAHAHRWPVLARGLADSRDRVAWAKARAPRIGASDAAKYAVEASWPLYMRAKLYNPFRGNAYTVHGNEREPHMLASFHMQQNFTLFHAAENTLHVATPDGIKLGGDGTLFLAQCKTSVKELWKIAPEYQRQMWWEQYVMGTDRTLFIWEVHEDGVPFDMEPQSQWFYRDDDKIAKLITIADRVLEGMAAAEQFKKEMES